MAKKSSGQKTLPKGVTIKFVRKAGVWCKTYALNGKIVQEWSSEKPDTSRPEESA